MDLNYEQRIKWIEEKRLKGNEQYKNGKFNAAIDTYTLALCCDLTGAKEAPSKEEMTK